MGIFTSFLKNIVFPITFFIKVRTLSTDGVNLIYTFHTRTHCFLQFGKYDTSKLIAID